MNTFEEEMSEIIPQSSIWCWAFSQGHNLNHCMELGSEVALSDNKRKRQGQKERLGDAQPG